MGQYAKLCGCYVVGSAGTNEKVLISKGLLLIYILFVTIESHEMHIYSQILYACI